MKENIRETTQEVPVQEQNFTITLQVDVSELAKAVIGKINRLQRKNSFNLII